MSDQPNRLHLYRLGGDDTDVLNFASGLDLGRAGDDLRGRNPDDLLRHVLLRRRRPDDDLLRLLLLLLRRPDDDGLAVGGPDGAADLELLRTSNVDRTLGQDLERSLARP